MPGHASRNPMNSGESRRRSSDKGVRRRNWLVSSNRRVFDSEHLDELVSKTNRQRQRRLFREPKHRHRRRLGHLRAIEESSVVCHFLSPRYAPGVVPYASKKQRWNVRAVPNADRSAISSTVISAGSVRRSHAAYFTCFARR